MDKVGKYVADAILGKGQNRWRNCDGATKQREFFRRCMGATDWSTSRAWKAQLGEATEGRGKNRSVARFEGKSLE
jgi:hypothetical protein